MGRFFVTRSVGRWLLCGDNFLPVARDAFLLGVLAKSVFLVWCFGGGSVVICVASVVFWQSVFWCPKMRQLF
jgi:hypothetical protein